MFKKIYHHIIYRKKLKTLKIYAVNQAINFIANKTDHVEGFQKLLLSASKSDNAEELQKMLNEFIDLAGKTSVANGVINDKKAKESKVV